MSQDQRATARSLMSKGDLGRTPAVQREDFDEKFADLPLGDDVTLPPAPPAASPPWMSRSRVLTATG